MIQNKWITHSRANRNFIKGEVTKQFQFFEGGQNKEFEEKVKLIPLSTDCIKFLQSDFCQEIFIENKLKIHIEMGI